MSRKPSPANSKSYSDPCLKLRPALFADMLTNRYKILILNSQCDNRLTG